MSSPSVSPAPSPVLTAMAEAQERVPAVVDRLKRVYGLRDADLALALGLSRKDVQHRRTSRVKFTPAEIAGLAVFFGVPIDTFYLRESDALRVVLQRDPNLDRMADVAPWAASGSNREPPG